LTAYRLIDVSNLVDFIKQIENKEAEVADFLFQDFADKWRERIEPHLKVTGYARRGNSLTHISPRLKGCKLNEISHERLVKWVAARSTASGRTFISCLGRP